AVPPPPLGWLDDEDPWAALARASEMALFTAPFNVTGQPAISLPMHWTGDGLPVGVQLVAPYGREDLLLRIGAQVEVLQPGAGRGPRWRDRRDRDRWRGPTSPGTRRPRGCAGCSSWWIAWPSSLLRGGRSGPVAHTRGPSGPDPVGPPAGDMKPFAQILFA